MPNAHWVAGQSHHLLLSSPEPAVPSCHAPRITTGCTHPRTTKVPRARDGHCSRRSNATAARGWLPLVEQRKPPSGHGRMNLRRTYAT